MKETKMKGKTMKEIKETNKMAETRKNEIMEQ